MDVRDLKFDSDSFDVAIDKGTMDAMMTVKGDVWVCGRFIPDFFTNTLLIGLKNPPEHVVESCTREVDEVLRFVEYRVSWFICCTDRIRLLRVLRKSGVFIYLTFGQPHFRKRFLTRPGTTLEIRKLGDSFHYYLYIVRFAQNTTS